ncbi:MAG: hypothetical protein LC115_13270 [Bacteroidia bacterium]|nr:hypothetical protein [Bacteroidia bacterium]
MRIFAGLIFCWGIITILPAQGFYGSGSAISIDTIVVFQDSTLLTHAGIIPETVRFLQGNSAHYQVDLMRGMLIKQPNSPKSDTLVVSYRYFVPEVFSLRSQHILLTKDSVAIDELLPETKPNSGFDYSQLQRSGSIARGITIGTNRDIAINSAFRLNLNGRISDDVSVLASITDENIPIQPSGTTQQLSDFDKVFLQFNLKKASVMLGDLELRESNSRFMSYGRNVLGLRAEYRDTAQKIYVIGSASKGKFNSNSFMGENGKQGPYRLSGKNNERFIIVLAGTEKVYVDGKRMLRGENNDYIIEYNTGELRFTSFRLITNNSRIVVDFEYTDRNYSRSLIGVGYSYTDTAGRWSIRATYAREADNPSAPIDVQLSDTVRRIAADAGDDPNLAILFGGDSVGWNPTQIRYQRKDTITNGTSFPQIFVFSKDSTKAYWQVSFVYAGPNSGYYTKDQSTLNGNIFRWVAPDSLTGKLNGDYQPIRKIPLPTSTQVANLSGNVQLNKIFSIDAEIAYSYYDKNRLSKKQDEDNGGLAAFTQLNARKIPIGKKIALNSFFNSRMVEARFQGLDRVYQMEYGREWNFNDLGERTREFVSEGMTELVGYGHRIRYQAGFRNTTDANYAVKHTLQWESQDSSTILGNIQTTYITTHNDSAKTISRWFRSNSDFYRLLWLNKLKIGTELWGEDKRISNSDSVLSTSFQFLSVKPYLKISPSTAWTVEINYDTRTDKEVVQSSYLNKSLSGTTTAKISYQSLDNLSILATATHRSFRVLDTTFISRGLVNQNTFLSNLQGNWQSKYRIFQVNIIYETLTEQIARRQVSYVEVNAGLGQYEWIDYNKNGLQDLDEFQIAVNPLQANFVKLLLPTQQLFPTISSSLSGVWRIEPGSRIKKIDANKQKWLQAIQLQTTARIEQKKDALTNQLSNYTFSLRRTAWDSTLLSAQYQFRQELFLFRNSPKGDASVAYSTNAYRLFLNSGNEYRQNNQWQTKGRINFSASRSIETAIQLGNKQSTAELLPERNFNIHYLQINPSFNWQLSRKIRWSIGYIRADKKDNSVVSSQVKTNKITTDLRANLGGRNTLFVKLDLFNHSLTGNPNTSTRFELLEGMQPGKNITANVQLVQFITKMLELTITYDARVSENNPIIHAARMQLRALF